MTRAVLATGRLQRFPALPLPGSGKGLERIGAERPHDLEVLRQCFQARRSDSKRSLGVSTGVVAKGNAEDTLMVKKSDNRTPYTAGVKRSFYTRCVKEAMDRLGAGICLVVLSPVLLLLLLLVMLADGRPALFSQERLGKGGRTFRMYKLRTMTVGSDSSFALNPDGSLRTSEDDPRITRLGRVLRRYSLDELPQLINVLKGDMSFVGPRPDLPFHAQLYTQEERRKLDLKPGITGLAQVCGRNSLPWKERLRLDVEYVNRASLWLDLSIVARTLAKVLASEGIYAEPAKSIKTARGGSRDARGQA